MIIDAKILSETLSIEEKSLPTAPVANIRPVEDEQLEADASYARSNLYSIIEMGKTALADSLNVAHQSENPRAFEVFGGLMKQLAEINQQLVDTQIKKEQHKAKIAKPENDVTPQQINNTAVFVGSTSELSRLVKGLQ